MYRSSCSAFQCQLYLTYHCNQKQQTLKKKQINMYGIQTTSQNGYTGGGLIQSFPINRTMYRSSAQRNSWIILKNRSSGSCFLIICQPQCLHKTQKQHTSNRISSSLVSQNFGCRNVQKHYNKQKHNLKLSNIYKQLQQLKIFQTNQTKQPGLMQKHQYQVEHGINRVFRTNHQISANPTSTCQQHKQNIHK